MFASGFTGGQGGAWSAGFPPFIAITALDDPDTTVRDAYFGWLAERHKHTNLEPTDRSIAEGCFASAVAVLLGAGAAEEAKLAHLLQDRFRTLTAMTGGAVAFNSDLPVLDTTENDAAALREVMHPAMDYQMGLALAWLHSKRRADAGSPVTTPGFPALPNNILFWPVPAVPANVVLDAQQGHTMLPIAAIQGTPTPTVFSNGAELFATDAPPQKSDVPAPVLPAVPSMMVFDRTIAVSQADGDIDTGIVLNDGDEFEIFANGSIWAADLTHGTNGPNGWDGDITWDTSFPLYGALDPVNAHPNCVLGRLGGYFFVGEHRPRQRFLYHRSCPLRLRINSNHPGGGSGSFQVRIQVWS
jgi:hypothetical protein